MQKGATEKQEICYGNEEEDSIYRSWQRPQEHLT